MIVYVPSEVTMSLGDAYPMLCASQMQISQSIELSSLQQKFRTIQAECCITKDIPRKTNCCNCGASLEGKHFCAFCGTYNE